MKLTENAKPSENAKLSEKAYINRIAIIGHAIIDAVLVLAYAVEVMKGSRTIGYYCFFSLLCMGPVIAELVIYSRNKESGALKHIICIGYGVLYLFAVFTTNSILTFTFAIPMFMVVILFMDVRSSVLIGTLAFLGNLIYVGWHFVTAGYSSEEMPDVEIRVMCMLLTGVFMVLVCMAVTKVNREKLRQIEAQTNAAKGMADSILGASGAMISGIGETGEKLGKLGESVEYIRNSMNEVTMGSTETAESVQVQMQRTEQIQGHIMRVKDTAALIEASMLETAQMVEDGRTQMEALAGQVEKSMNANEQVLAQMKALSEYTGQMNTIIETITSIANSTGMLALNASIEAARAGEAGRGFAVVAGQISTLANQTKTATVNITELIGNIHKELVSVEAAVDVVTESNRANSESTGTVAESLTGISRGTDNVGQKTKEMLKVVSHLEAANADIVDNIQTISAITEEVSAHAGETYHSCEENAALVTAVMRTVEKLNAEAEKLLELR